VPPARERRPFWDDSPGWFIPIFHHFPRWIPR
jgi:hypothetical protein